MNRVLVWCGIVALTAMLLPRLHRELPLDDFIEYWSASRLFVTGGNPYSPAQMVEVQHKIGWDRPQALMMFNPPWVLPLLAPVAALPFRTAQVFWLILMVVLLFGSANVLWRYYGGRPDHQFIAWCCAAAFYPNAVALRMGQLAPLMLFAATMFLICVRSQRFWLAGVSLFVFGVKPHLLIPVVLVVIAWSIWARRWEIIGGAVLATVLTTVAAATINPAAVAGYFDLWRDNPPLEFVSGLGGVLRLTFGPAATWLQFAPLAVAVLWAFVRWRRHYRHWDWGEQLPILLLGSLIGTPYGWTFDQPVLMVPLLRTAVSMVKRIRATIVIGAVVGNLVMAGMLFAGFSDEWFLWSAPLWTVLYAAALRNEKRITA
jgi:hypothetical protein